MLGLPFLHVTRAECLIVIVNDGDSILWCHGKIGEWSHRYIVTMASVQPFETLQSFNDLPIYDHLAAQRNPQTTRRKLFRARDDIALPARMDDSGGVFAR